jgi:hypothetical protein
MKFLHSDLVVKGINFGFPKDSFEVTACFNLGASKLHF